MTFCNSHFTFWTSRSRSVGSGVTATGCGGGRFHRMRDIRALAVALVLVLPGCGAANDDGAGGATASADDGQSVTPAMLAEGGIQFRPAAQEIPLDELGFDYGSDTARIRVIEISDYGCGYCRRFHVETFPTLLRDYIETGRVFWKYVTYASGMFPNGVSAAFVAECAGEQGLFPPVSDLLYERQADWKNQGDPFPVYEELAREAGVDVDELNTCIEEERPEARVGSGIVTGRNLGVRGTPAFVANGVAVMGAQPLEWWVEFFNAMEELVDQQAAGGGEAAGQAPPP